MLQRFVTGRGIASCDLSEYAPVSDNTINITNTSKRIEKLCDNNNIFYSKKKFYLNGNFIPTRLILPQKHIVIVNDDLNDCHHMLLAEHEWTSYNIFDYLGVKSELLDSIILETPYYFDFDFEFETLVSLFSLRTSTRKFTKKDYCTIFPYCTFPDQRVTILNEEPTTIEIEFLHQKNFNYYVKTNYPSRDALCRLLSYIKNL